MVLRLAAISCAVLAAVVLTVSQATGWSAIGLTLVAGILIGAGNGFAIDKLFGTGLPFGATSMLRLVAMSALVLLAVVVLGVTHAWPFVLGLGVANLVLAICAGVATVKGT